MTFLVNHPTARRAHRCGICGRAILPGEQYQRGFDTDYPGTYKTCAHCERCVDAWSRHSGEWEWAPEWVAEWLSDEHPAIWAAFLAGWRYPDGEIMPLPLQPRCISCGTLLSDWGLWCDPCDEARIERLSGQFLDLSRSIQ